MCFKRAFFKPQTTLKHFYTLNTSFYAGDRLRAMRRANLIPFDASVAHVDGCLFVDTDPGCLMRPLLRASELCRLPHLLATTHHSNLIDVLLAEGVLEYVDKQEEIALRVALSPYVKEF